MRTPPPHPLARARAARAWGRTRFARELQLIGGQRGCPVATTKQTVSRWERGLQEPEPPAQFLIAALFGIPAECVRARPWPHWLTADGTSKPAAHPWNPAGAVCALTDLTGLSGGDTLAIDRRTFLTGTAITASMLSWLTADPAAAGQISSARRLGEDAVAHIERRVADLRRADDVDGGGQLLTEAGASLALVTGLLRDRSYTDAHGRRLYAAAADLARQRGWAAFDVHGVCDDGAYQTALRAAHAAGDDALGANVLAFWAVSAYNTGRASEADTIADTAAASVRGRSTAQVEAMILNRRGRARAHVGDSRCWADFDRAENLLGAGDADQSPAWAYWFDRTEILGARASTHLDLGQPVRAEAAFAEADALFPASCHRTHALYLARMADAQVRQGDIEHACHTGHRALDLAETISSQRACEPLRGLTDKLAEHRGNRDADAFRERARTVLAA